MLEKIEQLIQENNEYYAKGDTNSAQINLMTMIQIMAKELEKLRK